MNPNLHSFDRSRRSQSIIRPIVNPLSSSCRAMAPLPCKIIHARQGAAKFARHFFANLEAALINVVSTHPPPSQGLILPGVEFVGDGSPIHLFAIILSNSNGVDRRGPATWPMRFLDMSRRVHGIGGTGSGFQCSFAQPTSFKTIRIRDFAKGLHFACRLVQDWFCRVTTLLRADSIETLLHPFGADHRKSPRVRMGNQSNKNRGQECLRRDHRAEIFRFLITLNPLRPWAYRVKQNGGR